MKKLNLCIDIDGTVTEPYYWIKRTNEYFNTSIKPHDVICYEIHDILGIKGEDYLEFYEKYGELLHKEANIRRGASQVINRLYDNHQIHFVTAREQRMKDVSLEWLKRYNLPMDSITLTGTHDKVQNAIDLNCDIFIEDRYENAIQLSEAGFEVMLLDCNYNKGILQNNIHRVKNWYQIERFIYEFSKEGEDRMVSSL